MGVYWGLYTSYAVQAEPREPTYHVEFYKQSTRDHLVARAYHYYETACFKIIKAIPGGFKAERWFYEHSKDEFAMPFTNAQDLRCFEFAHTNREMLFHVEVTEEQYRQVSKRVVL